MRGRLNHFKDVFWWSGVGQDTATPNNDPSAFIKLVFGSDTELERIETVVGNTEGCSMRATYRNHATNDPGRNDVAVPEIAGLRRLRLRRRPDLPPPPLRRGGRSRRREPRWSATRARPECRQTGDWLAALDSNYAGTLQNLDLVATS